MGLEPIINIDPFFYDSDKYYYYKVIFNWLYSIFIFLLISFQPILETVLAIQKKNAIYLSNTLFYYIIPIHYWISLFYFKNQRKKRVYESKNMKFLNSERGIGKCMPREETLIKSISIISLITIVDSILILFLFESPVLYNELSYSMNIISKILIVIGIIPGRSVLVINSHIFFFSFLQQLEKLKSLENKLRFKDWKKTNKTSVAILCYDIIDVRYTIKRLIEKTEGMYISTTIIGGISVGLILEMGSLNYYTVTSLVIYFIMQSIFLSVIYFIGNSRNEINEIVHTRNFASKYILRKNDFCRTCLNVEKIYIQKKNEENTIHKHKKLHSIRIEKKNELDLFNTDNKKTKSIKQSLKFVKKSLGENKSSDNKKTKSVRNPLNDNKLVLSDKNPLNENKLILSDKNPLNDNKLVLSDKNPLNENKLMPVNKEISININDTSSDFYTPKNVRSFEYSKDNVMNLLKRKEASITTSGNFLTNNDYIRCIYEWSINTGSSIDWIILTNLLNQDWASFGMFGVEFSNGKALRNAILVTSSLIASGTAAGILSKFI
jgi:hypothetical protein